VRSASVERRRRLCAYFFWGIAVIQDSAQFSALAAAAAERAASLITFQTALGFTFILFAVQVGPTVVELADRSATLAPMAFGPALGG